MTLRYIFQEEAKLKQPSRWNDLRTVTCTSRVSIAREGRSGCGGRVGDDGVLAELDEASSRSW